MGLDIAQLFMHVEEHYGIVFADDVASTLETVGLLHRAVVAELERRGTPRDPGIVFDELQTIICKHTVVKPERVVPEATFVRDLRMD